MRHEFTPKTKRLAYSLAWGVCMAEGPTYGLEPETRCTTLLSPGNHDYDHYPKPAHAEGSDSVENCMVVCKVHHAWKTAHFDIPAEAKIKRRRKAAGLDPTTRKPRKPIQSKGFGTQHRPLRSNREFGK